MEFSGHFPTFKRLRVLSFLRMTINLKISGPNSGSSIFASRQFTALRSEGFGLSSLTSILTRDHTFETCTWSCRRWVLRLCLNWIKMVLIWFSFISLLPSWEFNLVYFSWILIDTTGDSAQPQNWIDPESALIINKDYPEHPFVSNCPF